MLTEIADVTGGRYFRARNPRELASIYEMLDQLEPVEQESAIYRPRQSLGYIPLLVAILISFILAIAHCWRSGLLPRALSDELQESQS
jgi:Ca-activated chloride channel family protein